MAILALMLSVGITFAGCSAGRTARTEANPGLPAAASLPQDVALSEEQIRQLQLSREVLMSESADITEESRRNAASLLIDLGAPESREVLVTALSSTNEAALRAVLSALAERPADALLLGATIDALRTAPPELADVVASVLVAHGEAGLEGVAAVALDADDTVEHRVQAIHALGAFRNRNGLTQLMLLLEPERSEPREIVAATCTALQSLTGMRLDGEPQQWRDWWREFRDKPFAEVLRITVRRLNDQMANLEQQNARLSELYADALREIYLLLPLEEQLNRLASDLSHELPQVRRLALDRVDRLLRDQARLPDAVKQQLVQRLTDPVPMHRRMAARLLDEANQEGLRLVLAEILRNETDAATANEFMRVLVKRPTVEAADAALKWLTDATVGPNAALLLAQVAQSGTLHEEQAEAARTTVRSMITPTNGNGDIIAPPPTHARLLTILGKERDLVQLEAMLDTGTPELKQAIADGLAIIGRPAPLVARAQDPVVYPFAIRALSNGKPDVETLRQVVQLTPTDQQRDQWVAEVRNAASKLPIDQIVTADDVLAGLNGIDGRVRVQLLQRAIDIPAGEMPAALRRQVVVRASELLLALDEPTRALELLDSLDAQPADDVVRGLRLHAAVVAGLFDKAQEIVNDPREWIALLSTLVEQKSEMALALKRQIETRFLEQLDEPTRAAFEAASGKLQNSLEPEASVDATATDEPVTP